MQVGEYLAMAQMAIGENIGIACVNQLRVPVATQLAEARAEDGSWIFILTSGIIGNNCCVNARHLVCNIVWCFEGGEEKKKRGMELV